MMLQIGDDGVVSKVDVDDLIYVDKNELNELVDRYYRLKEENEQLKSFKSRVFNLLQDEIRKEIELLDYYIKEKAPYNAERQQIIISVLKRLQKELEE